MRVLFFIPVYLPATKFGGPVQSVSRIVMGLRSHGVHVDVLTTDHSIDTNLQSFKDYTDPTPLGRTLYLKSFTLFGCIFTKELRLIIDGLHEYDIIHMSSIWHPLGLFVACLAKLYSIKTIQSTRGALSKYSFSRKTLKKLLYFYLFERPVLRFADRIHITSSLESCDVLKVSSYSRILLSPNPYSPSNSYCLRQTQAPPGSMRKLLICGRFHHKKGLEIIPHILSELVSYNWTLSLVGVSEDSSKASLLESMASYGLLERVKDLGSVSSLQLSSIYSESHLVLIPSLHENFCNVALEALVHSCQVLITPETGIACFLNQLPKDSYGAILKRDRLLWTRWLKGWFHRPYSFPLQTYDWIYNYFDPLMIASRLISDYNALLSTNDIRQS